MNRSMIGALLCATLTLTASCSDDDGTGPAGGDGIRFDTEAASYSASGTPMWDIEGGVLTTEFAVAHADSVGGFSVIGYDPTGVGVGSLFVIQAPREATTFTCSEAGEPCHGRLITGVGDLSTVTWDAFFTISEGSLTIHELGPDRLRAGFSATLVELSANDTIRITNGTIDVPYFDDEVTVGALECLLSLVGLINGTCR
jgi:hypothetical protein